MVDVPARLVEGMDMAADDVVTLRRLLDHVLGELERRERA